MDYYEIRISGPYQEDLLIGLLSDWPFESFMEKEEAFCAYLPVSEYQATFLQEIRAKLTVFGLNVEAVLIKTQNWNDQWEKSFKPVIIDDFCAITADFHRIDPKTKYHLKINPRMAFGTGHHETTWMMIDQMKQIVWKDKSVFDYGTGTGVLAILAYKMGAEPIHAIDYDPKAIENALDNATINHAGAILLKQCELPEFELKTQYDVILANINFPVLMKQAHRLKSYLKSGGFLLISGILNVQKEQIIAEYESKGINLQKVSTKGEWSCLLMKSEK